MSKTYAPIVATQTYQASIKEVWSAISEADKMRQWYFPDIGSFVPEVGFETQFVVQVEDRVFPHHWKVIEVIPHKKIAYEWRFEGYHGLGVSLFELTETDQSTTLTLTFSVIDDFPDDIPEFKRESGVQGWNYLIKESLKNYLETKNDQL